MESNEENTFSRKKRFMARENRQLVARENYYLISVRDRDLAINCLEKEEIDIVLVEEKVLRENSFLCSLYPSIFPKS